MMIILRHEEAETLAGSRAAQETRLRQLYNMCESHATRYTCHMPHAGRQNAIKTISLTQTNRPIYIDAMETRHGQRQLGRLRRGELKASLEFKSRQCA